MNCAGRPLAQVEMRMVIATLLLRFDVRFADGFDQQQWLDGLTDRFSLGTDGSLRIVVEKRS
jgi:cytochrome P450